RDWSSDVCSSDLQSKRIDVEERIGIVTSAGAPKVQEELLGRLEFLVHRGGRFCSDICLCAGTRQFCPRQSDAFVHSFQIPGIYGRNASHTRKSETPVILVSSTVFRP